MNNGFEIEVHPYRYKCGDFMVNIEELSYDDFFGADDYKRIITCKHYKRCKAIEEYLRKEIKNEV